MTLFASFTAQAPKDRTAPYMPHTIEEPSLNVCELLEARLKEAGFNVLNHGTRIPFPSAGQQNKFRERVRQVLVL